MTTQLVTLHRCRLSNHILQNEKITEAIEFIYHIKVLVILDKSKLCQKKPYQAAIGSGVYIRLNQNEMIRLWNNIWPNGGAKIIPKAQTSYSELLPTTKRVDNLLCCKNTWGKIQNHCVLVMDETIQAGVLTTQVELCFSLVLSLIFWLDLTTYYYFRQCQCHFRRSIWAFGLLGSRSPKFKL